MHHFSSFLNSFPAVLLALLFVTCRSQCTNDPSNDGYCLIDCTNTKECQHTLISCAEDYDCFIDCSNFEACFNTSITCPSSDSCYLNCAEPYGWGCELASIQCPMYGDCNIDCGAETSCFTSTVTCPSRSGECNIFCSGFWACCDVSINCNLGASPSAMSCSSSDIVSTGSGSNIMPGLEVIVNTMQPTQHVQITYTPSVLPSDSPTADFPKDADKNSVASLTMNSDSDSADSNEAALSSTNVNTSGVTVTRTTTPHVPVQGVSDHIAPTDQTPRVPTASPDISLTRGVTGVPANPSPKSTSTHHSPVWSIVVLITVIILSVCILVAKIKAQKCTCLRRFQRSAPKRIHNYKIPNFHVKKLMLQSASVSNSQSKCVQHASRYNLALPKPPARAKKKCKNEIQDVDKIVFVDDPSGLKNSENTHFLGAESVTSNEVHKVETDEILEGEAEASEGNDEGEKLYEQMDHLRFEKGKSIDTAVQETRGQVEGKGCPTGVGEESVER